MERDSTPVLMTRAALLDMEYRLMRAPPQIAFEILLCVFIAGGSCEISAIYKRVRATEAAVRRHMRQLENQGLIYPQRRSEDRRKAVVKLTAKGEELRLEYAMGLGGLLAASGHALEADCASVRADKAAETSV